MNWTEENTAELLKLWAEGKSGSQIGRIFGCGRGAVFGKLRRLERKKRQPLPNSEAESKDQSAWDRRTFAPYPIWKAERQKERERGLR